MREPHKRLDDSQRDNVILLANKGIATKEIASVLAIGETTIIYIIRAYKRVGERDFAAIKKDSGLMKNLGVIRWACRAHKVDENEFLETLVNGEKKPEPPKEEQPKEKPETSVSDLEDAIHVASRLIIEQVNRQHHEDMEMLAKKLDQIAVIIQSSVKAAMDKNNANADIAFKELQAQSENLSAIRSNTKNLRFVRG